MLDISSIIQGHSGDSDSNDDLNELNQLNELNEPELSDENEARREVDVSSSDDFQRSEHSSDNCELEDTQEVAKRLSSAFVETQALTYSKHTVARAFYNTAYKHRHHIRRLVQDKWSWNSYKSARNRLLKLIPSVKIQHYLMNKETGEIKLVVGSKLPEKKYLANNKYELQSAWSRVKIADALATYDKIHKITDKNQAKSWLDARKPPVKIIISMDGVPIDNSSGLVLEVLSFKLKSCDTVLPIGIHIGKSKEKSLDRIFEPVIEELQGLNVEVASIVADSPQRASLLNMDAVTAYFGCAKCFSRGEPNMEKQAKGDGKGASVIWPIETLWQPERTMEAWLQDIAASAINKQHGIKGDTPLRKLVSCLIKQVPLDVFHIVYLGMVKRIIKQVFRIKDAGPTGIMREVKARVDKEITNVNCVQYPSDFSRRPRPISLPMYKSSEWRSLVTAGFMLVTDAFEEFKQTAATKLWGYFVFLVKSFLLPNEQFNELLATCNLKSVMNIFYRLYVRVCQKRSCAPNVHMFHHLLQARKEQEFTEATTEPFEASYAILKKSYQVGTKSQGKQMLERMYTVLLAKDQHFCKRKLRIRPKTKAKYNDSLIVTKDHRFYKVVGRLADENYVAKRIVTGHFSYPHTPALPFQKIWTHKYLGEMTRLHEVAPGDIIGKAVICKDIITLLTEASIFG